MTRAGRTLLGDAPPAPISMLDLRVGAIALRMQADYRWLPPESWRDFGSGERFALAFPDFEPGRSSAITQDEQNRLVFLTITPADSTLSPIERPARLYARFLESEGARAPGGLWMRRFQAGTPYAGEDLYIVPPEGRLFYARCERALADLTPLRSGCLTELRLDGLDVLVRFSPSLLAHWERLREGVIERVQGWRVDRP